MSDADKILTELLVLQCQRNDANATTQLVALFEKPLLYYLRRIVQSETDAWDVFQETWISVLRSIQRLEEPRAFPVYLFRTGRNAALLHLRKRGVDSRLLTAVDRLDVVTETEPVFSRDEAAAVHSALDKLSLPHREALTLFFLQDMSVDQIATVLQVPVGTVKSRIHYGKKELFRLLTKGETHGK